MNTKIILDHGSGGKLANQLIQNLMLPAFDNPILGQLHDGAVFDIGGLRLAFSTDSYVVDPIFFPGGNIGDLSVNGTVNDLAMCGAVPLYLSAGLIIEEGFDIDALTVVIRSMAAAARHAGARIVTGDTKVVPRGAADKIFINTSGVGVIPGNLRISADQARPGDRILLSGTIADHGMTILTLREGLAFQSPLCSDTAALNHLVAAMLDASDQIHVLRDPTRGGVGTALNEIAAGSKVDIRIYEDRIPIAPEVAGVCELLGFDPLYVANEGKLLAFVGAADAENVLRTVRQDPLGQNACIIGEVRGEVTSESIGTVSMETRIGGMRRIDMLAGAQLPRIC